MTLPVYHGLCKFLIPQQLKDHSGLETSLGLETGLENFGLGLGLERSGLVNIPVVNSL